ncbi:MAG: HEPN domain-containing protein [Nitrospirota bacterium]
MRGAIDYLTQAEEDLNIAKEKIKTKNYDWVITRAQLCVINAFKALIEYKAGHHRSNTISGILNELSAICDIPTEICQSVNAVSSKTPMPSERICKFVTLQAEMVLGWVSSMMGYQESGSGGFRI